ncbi:MAG: hypothetical protein IH991_00505 [Planctomycetes bacterium]|nr:hypothetical protein [Planctomycetota bacterium]
MSLSETLAGLQNDQASECPSPLEASPPATEANGQLVYALGQLGYDFGTAAVRDSFKDIGPDLVDDKLEMLGYLRAIYKPFTEPGVLEGMLNENCPDVHKVHVVLHEKAGPFIVNPTEAKNWPVPKDLDKWLKNQPPWGAGVSTNLDLHRHDVQQMLSKIFFPFFGQVAGPLRSNKNPINEKLSKAALEQHYFRMARMQMLSRMMYNKPAAARLIWTLMREGTPVYAVRPHGAFAAETYDVLIQFLLDQEVLKTDWVSIPGKIVGEVTLLDKQVIPVIEPEIMGMINWNVSRHEHGEEDAIEPGKKEPAMQAEQQPAMQAKEQSGKPDHTTLNIKEKMTYELRNAGRKPSERALNFGTTTAFQIEMGLRSPEKHLELDSLKIEQNPICRQGSDCWDMLLTYFNPHDNREAHQVFRFTVDVSDVIPLSVEEPRDWRMR